MDAKELKNIIKEIIREEFLEEMSTTGGASGGLGPPQVPHAFSGKDKKKKVGWRGEEFGVESMPNPDDRRTNAVDDNDPAKLREMVIRERPSSSSHLAFPISKEIKDFFTSVENYRKSEQEKFINNLKGKLQGKAAKFFAKKDSLKSSYKAYTAKIMDVEGEFTAQHFYVVLVATDGRFYMSSDINKKMLIYGAEDAPVTQRSQNRPTQDTDSQNKVKI